MKLSDEQQQKLWGEDDPYSQAHLNYEYRILGDSASRSFVLVEIEINPFTYEMIEEHREDFEDDEFVQGIIDNSFYESPEYGYIAVPFRHQLYEDSEEENDKIKKEANKILEKSQEAIIRMHKFVMEKTNE